MKLLTGKAWKNFQLVLMIVAVSSLPIVDLPGQQASESDDEPSADSASHLKQIVEIELQDKEILKGRLCLPNSDSEIRTLVVFVSGTGPGTYLNRRKMGDKVFNFFDYLAGEFNDRNVAFFSYNKRGVTMGDKPPMYQEVDREKFKQVVPHVEVSDIATVVRFLKRNERLARARVALLGSSEGTIIAPLVVEKHPKLIDAVLLAGYSHENLYDVINWQLSGHGSMRKLNPVFDRDDDGKISKAEYEADDDRVLKGRKQLLQKADFKTLDATGDEILDTDDFAIRLKPLLALLMYNTAKGNDDWIWNNYFQITSAWLKEHFSLEANKTRLTRLEIPIYVFHGVDDAHLDVQGVYDLKKRFETLGKTNLKTFVFDDHDHSLNFASWITTDQIPEGYQKMFQVVSELGEVE